jgi:hypothetical protein
METETLGGKNVSMMSLRTVPHVIPTAMIVWNHHRLRAFTKPR